ncbi:MAG: ABC transporter permease [Candidatus Saganbacteria bacterium]|nr:ABC transporter permease [Candidatus Saganbacteria bacterium]
MSTFSNLEFFVVEAFRGIGRSPLMSFVAIGIVTVTLTIFGFFMLGVINLGNVVSTMGAKLDITSYVNKDLSNRDAAELEVRLKKIDGVEKVNYYSKDDSWKDFKEEYSGKLELGEVVSENPLPNTFAIKVRSPEILPNVAAAISKIEEIDEVRYSGKLISQVQNLVEAVRLAGFVFVFLLFFATLLIVVNTIRLTVLARETDIYIMRLVGATSSFVRWPFVIEGIVIGVGGGVFAVLLLRATYETLAFKVSAAFPFLPVVTDSFLLSMVFAAVGITGAMLGMIGGYISVSRLLKNA